MRIPLRVHKNDVPCGGVRDLWFLMNLRRDWDAVAHLGMSGTEACSAKQRDNVSASLGVSDEP